MNQNKFNYLWNIRIAISSNQSQQRISVTIKQQLLHSFRHDQRCSTLTHQKTYGELQSAVKIPRRISHGLCR